MWKVPVILSSSTERFIWKQEDSCIFPCKQRLAVEKLLRLVCPYWDTGHCWRECISWEANLLFQKGKDGCHRDQVNCAHWQPILHWAPASSVTLLFRFRPSQCMRPPSHLADTGELSPLVTPYVFVFIAIGSQNVCLSRDACGDEVACRELSMYLTLSMREM